MNFLGFQNGIEFRSCSLSIVCQMKSMNGSNVRIGSCILAGDMDNMVRFYRDTLGLQTRCDGGDFAEFETASGALSFWLYSRKEFVKAIGESFARHPLFFRYLWKESGQNVNALLKLALHSCALSAIVLRLNPECGAAVGCAQFVQFGNWEKDKFSHFLDSSVFLGLRTTIEVYFIIRYRSGCKLMFNMVRCN